MGSRFNEIRSKVAKSQDKRYGVRDHAGRYANGGRIGKKPAVVVNVIGGGAPSPAPTGGPGAMPPPASMPPVPPPQAPSPPLPAPAANMAMGAMGGPGKMFANGGRTGCYADGGKVKAGAETGVARLHKQRNPKAQF